MVPAGLCHAYRGCLLPLLSCSLLLLLSGHLAALVAVAAIILVCYCAGASGAKGGDKVQVDSGHGKKVKTRQVGFPSPSATEADWGSPEHAHCVLPYSWTELLQGYKNNSLTFKAGGLGKLMEENGHETWQCVRDHYCATNAKNPWFCFVYDESNKSFTPWGENEQLELVREEGCPASCTSEEWQDKMEALGEGMMKVRSLESFNV